MNKPNRLRIRNGLATIVLAISLLASMLIPSQKEADALSAFDTELLALLNEHRQNRGLAPFAEYAPLSQASLNWSIVMRNRTPFNACQHSGIDHDTEANIGSQGQPAGTTRHGENIACAIGSPGLKQSVNWSYSGMPAKCNVPLDFTTPLLTFCGWINSSGHRQSIENPIFTQIGVGTTIQIQGNSHKPISTTRFSNAPVTRAKYVPINPTRILDSRFSGQGQYSTHWTGGLTRTLDVTGVGGVPATGVDAVVLNVTSVAPNAFLSWLTVSPTGEPVNTTALHNFGVGTNTTQQNNDVIIAKVGSDGTIRIGNYGGNVDLVVDVVGYYTKSAGYGYVPVTSDRLLDTRGSSPWTAGQTRQVDVTGVGPLPGSGVEAVVLNVTTVAPTAPNSWLTIFPSGESPSSTAAVNFGTAAETTQSVNDLVVAKVGSNGTISIKNAHGNVHLVIDVVGYYASSGGHSYTPANPRRILDTRNNSQGQYSTPWTSGQTRTVSTTLGNCAKAAVLHVTTVNPTSQFSWITATASGTAATNTAALTFGRGADTSEISNDIMIVPTGSGGNINLRNAGGNVDLVIDLVGSYGTC